MTMLAFKRDLLIATGYVNCPKCGAKPLFSCVKKRRSRVIELSEPHGARVRAVFREIRARES